MAETPANGRHRAEKRFNPLAEIGVILTQSAQPAVKSSAILAASGGLVAALSLPAHATAAPSTTSKATPSAAAADTARARFSAAASRSTVRPAVVAPAATAPVVSAAFGITGFTAVAKPKPKPKPVVVQLTTTSNRSSSSSSSTSSSRTYTSSRPATGGVLGIAASLSGIYYVYGGSTPAGFDCSGFTSYVFRQVGISLPRTAAGQQAGTTRVSNPQPGDLVFFGYPAYHVGIYAGNGMMYDSPTTGKTTGLHKIWSTNVTYGRP